MIPAAYARTRKHRLLWGAMKFLDAHAPGMVVSRGMPRNVLKQVAIRKREIHDQIAAAHIRNYFVAEREQVLHNLSSYEEAIDAMLPDLRQTIADVAAPVVRHYARYTARHLRRRWTAKDEADPFDRLVRQYLQEHAGRKVTDVSANTKAKIREALAAGYARGESVEQISRRIDRLYLDEIIPARSLTIARTELAAASNWASLMEAQQTGEDMQREWMALDDDRTRDWHAEADGQTVGLDEPFIVDDEELDYPGDPKGSPENIINCRCTVLYHV